MESVRFETELVLSLMFRELRVVETCGGNFSDSDSDSDSENVYRLIPIPIPIPKFFYRLIPIPTPILRIFIS